MLAYILRRLLLMIPTILGIMAVSFAIVQFVPGGPVERAIAQLQGADQSSTAQFGGGGGQIGSAGRAGGGRHRLALSRLAGPRSEIHQGAGKAIRLRQAALGNGSGFWCATIRPSISARAIIATCRCSQLIKEKLPVSISLGLWMTVISYAISIPLGIRKAVKDGSRFDTVTSALVIFGYAIPSFLFAVLLVVLFCGGSFWQIFPLRGLTSDNFADLSWPHKILDYLWHITLPVTALVLGSFATSTLLTKNSFLDEIKKAYVQTARMKGLTERRVLYGHVFRNAMLIVIAGFPGAFIGAFFTGSLLIEQVFSLDGLGYLSYDSLIQRDYPVVLANLYIFALIGLVVNLISDLTYTWIDPRIDFETREV